MVCNQMALIGAEHSKAGDPFICRGHCTDGHGEGVAVADRRVRRGGDRATSLVLLAFMAKAWPEAGKFNSSSPAALMLPLAPSVTSLLPGASAEFVAFTFMRYGSNCRGS